MNNNAPLTSSKQDSGPCGYFPRLNLRPVDVQFVLGISGYFHKDLEAVRRSARYSSLENDLLPTSPGFTQVVQPGGIISNLLLLANGSVAIGDCVGVVFAGNASRDAIFPPEEHVPFLEACIRPWFLSCDLSSFRNNADQADGIWLASQGKRLHTALRYGITQALLSATSLIRAVTMAEIIAQEWDISIGRLPVDILASCHRGDMLQLDRMIMKQVALLPHASFLHVNDIGPQGKWLLEYVHSVAKRVQQRGASGYCPRLHFDVYGTLGNIFAFNNEISTFLARSCQAARPYELLIESPIPTSTKTAQIQSLANLRLQPRQRKVAVKLVADEWCNTLNDIETLCTPEQ